MSGCLIKKIKDPCEANSYLKSWMNTMDAIKDLSFGVFDAILGLREEYQKCF